MGAGYSVVGTATRVPAGRLRVRVPIIYFFYVSPSCMDVEASDRLRNLMCYSLTFLEELNTTTKNVRIACLRVESRTRDLQIVTLSCTVVAEYFAFVVKQTTTLHMLRYV